MAYGLIKAVAISNNISTSDVDYLDEGVVYAG